MPTTATRHLHVEHVMGTAVTIDLRADRPDLVATVVTWLHEVDATFSTYKPGSVVRRLARGELALDAAGAGARGELPPAAAGADVRSVVRRCEHLRLQTGGAFDARVGTPDFDPSALVKGW